MSSIDIELSDFGENFDPSKLDYASQDKERTRDSVLRVPKKVVDLPTGRFALTH